MVVWASSLIGLSILTISGPSSRIHGSASEFDLFLLDSLDCNALVIAAASLSSLSFVECMHVATISFMVSAVNPAT